MQPGIPPFAGATEKESFALTLKGTVKWSLLNDCSPTLRDLVSKMLTYNPAKVRVVYKKVYLREYAFI